MGRLVNYLDFKSVNETKKVEIVSKNDKIKLKNVSDYENFTKNKKK